ncbi:glycosyltransferase [uncultured Friedmanniella sp.]|uniref:glycosyltransferase n=1 Tax=uncultured Friedmanniella sp. TaxID=335381 RepID=UPI0035C99FBD
MKTLLTMDDPGPGVCGSEVYAVKLAQALAGAGLPVDLLVDCLNNSLGPVAGKSKRPERPVEEVFRSLPGFVKPLGRSREQVTVVHRASLPDYRVINVHGTGQQAFLAVASGRPTVVTVHGYDRRRLDHPVLRSQATLVAVGREQATELERDGFRVRAIIPPGVDLTRFCPGPADESALDIPPGAKVILHVGQLIPRKNVKLLLRAARRVRRSVELVVVVIGDGPLLPALRALAEQLEIGPQIRFVPHVPHDALVSYYRRADATVVPSLAESFSLVSLEAMSCGSPLIVSHAVGEIVREFSGIGVFDPRSESQLADAIVSVLDHEPDGVDPARLAEFDWTKVALRYAALFATLDG